MAKKIGLLGYGKMSKTIESLNDKRIEISSIKTRTNSFKDFIKNIDVIVDFSLPDGTIECLNFLIENKIKIPLVIGTTDLKDVAFDLMNESNCPIVYAPNMSFMIANLSSLLKKADELLCSTCKEVDIVESHHKYKKDSPSGTALLLKKSISNKYTNIHSIRRGNIFGNHNVYFTTDDEEICLSHTSFSRLPFAKGAIEATCFIVDKPPSIYSINDVIDSL